MRDNSTHGRHQMVNMEIRLIILFAAKDGENANASPSSYSQQSKTGTDYGSDHEFLTVKFRFKSKKVGKISKPFRYT